ncbi:MAG: MBL fold metallo-hydrolase [Burkholderiales bacterium]|nr:MBL fold metallo-hydrolase [Burkholderiales bacterium]
MDDPYCRTLVRDWLNANHVLLLGDDDNVLIDAGHVTHAAATVDLVRGALGGRPLHRLINTHAHSDHIGGNATVQRAFGCSITVPIGEAPLIDRWDVRELWLDYAGQQAERFRYDAVVRPGDTLQLAGRPWQVIAAPGHDMGAVMFWQSEDRTLVSGDALWERGLGVVLPGDGWRDRLGAARDTLERIRRLAPRRVIPGHGQPFDDAATAIDASLARITAFEADETKLARHVLKVMFVFTLLERGGIDGAALGATLAAIPLYREYDAAYFDIGIDALAELLVDDLRRVGAIELRDGRIIASSRAG